MLLPAQRTWRASRPSYYSLGFRLVAGRSCSRHSGAPMSDQHLLRSMQLAVWHYESGANAHLSAFKTPPQWACAATVLVFLVAICTVVAATGARPSSSRVPLLAVGTFSDQCKLAVWHYESGANAHLSAFKTPPQFHAVANTVTCFTFEPIYADHSSTVLAFLR